ncbi:CXXC motif containing zinc binding protein isoform X1 [Manis javanica]|uniref:CXXC motif containing zinc binding protein isoform X1 n=2 Tax=Manis javanica TaxID=9974 RepID=UPI000813B81A|nr:CXXC motif containing zinc binding protein isoform X1 [Manis javanica]
MGVRQRRTAAGTGTERWRGPGRKSRCSSKPRWRTSPTSGLWMKCGNCGEISEKWQYIRLMDNVALKGGRGSASMVQKCKLCARENSIEILSSTIKSYNAEDNEKFKTIVQFECRGLEPVDFQPQAGFVAEGVESGTVFSDINLQEKDWNDYDEKTQESVGIYEVTHQFVKC